MVPEAIEVRAKRFDAGGVQLVEPAIALGPVDDQMRVLQDSQVLGNGRTADGEASSKFADRLRTVEEPLEDGPSGRITQGVQLPGMLVSNH